MRVEYAKIFALAFMLFATQAMWTVFLGLATAGVAFMRREPAHETL